MISSQLTNQVENNSTDEGKIKQDVIESMHLLNVIQSDIDFPTGSGGR